MILIINYKKIYKFKIKIMEKFKIGDRFIARKPNDTNERPGWPGALNRYDGKELTVESLSPRGFISITDNEGFSWLLNPSWCEKIEDTPIQENTNPIDTSLTDWEQREYNLYISLIEKYTDRIMDGEEILIRNCRTIAKNIINEFKK